MPYFGDSGGLGSKVAGASPVNIAGAPGTPIMPSAQALLELNSGAANLLIGFRATIGSADDVAASENLATGFATAQSGHNTAVIFNSATPVSRVDVVGIMNGTATGNCMDYEDSATTALANMTTFTFSTPVEKVVVSCTPTFASGQTAQISVEGYSYA